MSRYANTVTAMNRFNLYLHDLAKQAAELRKQYDDTGLATASDADKVQAVSDAGLDYGDTNTAVKNLLDESAEVIDALDKLINNGSPTVPQDRMVPLNKIVAAGQSVPPLR